jgi:hypothetical protein
MPISPLRLVKNSVEYCSKEDLSAVPPYTRGIYVLYKYRRHYDAYNVVYVGLAGGDKAGVRGRLYRHQQSKGDDWSHFSVYQVWDNIREEEVRELEGLFRHIYRYDHKANKLNKQRGFKKLNQVRSNWFDEWD